MNDSQAMVAQSAKLAKKSRNLEKQLEIALKNLKEFTFCDLNEENCASLELASKRVRNKANLALEEIRLIGEMD